MRVKKRPHDPAAEAANLAKLPERCYAFVACHPAGNRIVLIERGERGYQETGLDDPKLTPEQAKTHVAIYNQKLGVTAAQQQAMLAGSLFGFDVPAADPDVQAGHIARRPILAPASPTVQ